MITAVFMNGCFKPELSDVAQLPADVIIRAVNNGMYLSLPDNCSVAKPIKLEYRSDGQVESIDIQHVIELGRNSKLTLVDEYSGNVENIAYTANTKIIQKENSSVSLVCLKTGAQSSHDKIHVLLSEKGAECKTAGFYAVQRNNQTADYHVTIEHAAAHTTSDMLFKGTAENKSRAGFIGRVHVHPHAQKIIAHQANHHLLLTRDAEVYSKPELEIYADDVKCKHGSTTGQLDQEALFYLRARGIEEVEAKRMMIAGFADEVLRRVQ
jgi:Fe-S cluster assembly protein SufD